jgi:hypothetical protein
MSAPSISGRCPWIDVGPDRVAGPDHLEAGNLVTPNWQEALVGRFPQLFRRHVSERSIHPISPFIGPGWRQTVETLVQRLSHIVGTRPVEIIRILERCGRLRVHTWTADAGDYELQMEMDYAIALAEARCACTCERCGREGSPYRSGSMRLIRCADHAAGDPAPARRGMEGVHLVRKMVAGRPGPISAGRYDRATDTFTDVDPSSLFLEDPI